MTGMMCLEIRDIRVQTSWFQLKTFKVILSLERKHRKESCTFRKTRG